MKRMIVAMSVVCLMASIALADPVAVSGTDYFTIPQTDYPSWDLLHWYPANGGMVVDTDMNGGAPGIGKQVAPNNTEFQLDFVQPAGVWRDDILGWSMFDPGAADDTLPAAYYDLSDWGGWTISFHNESYTPAQTSLKAQLVMNIGWTDSPWSEYNLYVQGVMLEFIPCTPGYLTMDFTNVQAWGKSADGSETYDGDWIDISSDPRLVHVSTLGVKIGSDIYPNDVAVKICLDTVPLPGAVLLGFLGLGVAGLRLRKHEA